MDSSETSNRGVDVQVKPKTKQRRTTLINGDVRLHFELEQELGRGAYGTRVFSLCLGSQDPDLLE